MAQVLDSAVHSVISGTAANINNRVVDWNDAKSLLDAIGIVVESGETDGNKAADVIEVKTKGKFPDIVDAFRRTKSVVQLGSYVVQIVKYVLDAMG